MEFLSQLFGNLTSGMIRLGVAVGIIAAVGVFIVKPVLDSTDHDIDSADRVFEGSNFDVKSIEAQIQKSVAEAGAGKQAKAQVERSFKATDLHGDPDKILHCIQRADGNVHRIERCSKKFR